MLLQTGSNKDLIFHQSATCENVDCEYGKECRIRNNMPKCVCPSCRKEEHIEGNVCGIDVKTYHSKCSLVRHNCRRKQNIQVDYKGRCRSKFNMSHYSYNVSFLKLINYNNTPFYYNVFYKFLYVHYYFYFQNKKNCIAIEIVLKCTRTLSKILQTIYL